MNQNKLNFESESLVVDYISFNIQGIIDKEHINKIAFYLYKSFGFNSTFTKDDMTEIIISNDQNEYQVCFRQFYYEPKIKSFWVGTKVNFSGRNAQRFYNQIKISQFNWQIFYPTKVTLSRIDLYYLRKTKINDPNQLVEDFMEKSRQRVITKNKHRKANWNFESSGLVLRIGRRTSSKYYRVYQNDQGLKFELELKNPLLKSFQELLIDNRMPEFEHELSKQFYSQSFGSLNLNSSYTDWLLHWYRKFYNTQKINGFTTTYLKNESSILFHNKHLIFNYLRILSYIKNHATILESFKIPNDEQIFHVVNFRLIDFISYIKLNQKNHRQRIQIIEIFKKFEYLHNFKLQAFRSTLDESLILNGNYDNSNYTEFTSVVMIPFIKIKKIKNVWNVNLLVANQFYEYKFPFQFDDYFLHWNTTYQFEVKTQIIKLITQTTIKKKLDVEEFFKPFNKLSNAKKTKIKTIFIEAIEQEIKNKSIQSKFHIVQKDNSVKYINQLRPINLTKSKYIYFYESIDFRELNF